MTTNYEKIKAMSIDEMAEFVNKIQNGEICPCNNCKYIDNCSERMDLDLHYDDLCIKFKKQWLNQEAE